MPERSPYQERVIRNYYRNQGAIKLQKLEEMVTDLYLAEGKARAKLWERAAAALEKVGVPKSRIDHVVKSDDPRLLASLVKQLLARQE
jgi:hypothetical protein